MRFTRTIRFIRAVVNVANVITPTIRFIRFTRTIGFIRAVVNVANIITKTIRFIRFTRTIRFKRAIVRFIRAIVVPVVPRFIRAWLRICLVSQV